VSKFGSIWSSSLGVVAVLSDSPELATLCLERTDSGTYEIRHGKLKNLGLRSENELQCIS
jgi:hypothetical protein